MTDIETRLTAAMHAAVDAEHAAAGELLKQVRRRHRRHNALVATTVALVLLTAAVSANVAVHVATPGSPAAAGQPSPQRTALPDRMAGLPMSARTTFRFLVTSGDGATWYSTATGQTEPIAGLPSSPGGYQFERVDGGWLAWPVYGTTSTCRTGQLCAGVPNPCYYIATGHRTATLIGTVNGVANSSRPGTVWVQTFAHSTDVITTAAATIQLVSTAGQPLGPRYRLPAGYSVDRGVGGDLLLLPSTGTSSTGMLWNPRTRQVTRRFSNVVDAGPQQLIWSQGCDSCRLQILNVATGNTVMTKLPGGLSSQLGETLTDDGKLLAAQLPGRDIQVLNTSTGAVTVIPGTAVSNADWQNFSWQNGAHRLIVTAGPSNGPGPAQIGYWQPGDTRLRVEQAAGQAEISVLQTGTIGT